MSIRSQTFSTRSLASVGSSRTSGAAGLSFGSGSSFGFGSGSSSGSGYGSGYGSGLGFASGSGSGFGSSLGYGSGAGLGFGSGSGSGSGYGLGLVSGFGAGALSSGLRSVGGGLSGGGSSIGASFRAGAGSFTEAVSNIISEKQQMQVLNDRLATYLEKVKRLETINHELNEKLRAFTANRVQTSLNLEPYEIQIRPLREKLVLLIQDHTRISLALDNAKLATDDFRIKLETEQALRQSVEGDIAGLRTLKTEYESTNAVLRQELTGLSEECVALRNAHQKEMVSLRGQMAGTVTVDVKEIESADLSRVLAEIRSEYETAIEKNQREAESWYTRQVEKRQAETAVITETTVSGSSEITDSRKHSLSLHTQLDAAVTEKASLEQRLLELQSQYQAQLFSLAHLAGSLEGELSAVRESALQQSRDYQLLLSTKVQLEREISTYKALLERAGEMSAISIPATKALRKVELVEGALAAAGAAGGVSVSTEVHSSSSIEVSVGGATVSVGGASAASGGGASAESGGGASAASGGGADANAVYS